LSEKSHAVYTRAAEEPKIDVKITTNIATKSQCEQ